MIIYITAIFFSYKKTIDAEISPHRFLPMYKIQVFYAN